MSNWNAADTIAYRAHDLHEHQPDKIKGSFPMYSYYRPGNLFWTGFAKACLDKGLSESETQSLMQSTLMRHGLDNYEEQIEKIGASFLTDSMVDWSKNNTPS